MITLGFPPGIRVFLDCIQRLLGHRKETQCNSYNHIELHGHSLGVEGLDLRESPGLQSMKSLRSDCIVGLPSPAMGKREILYLWFRS
jgi:hypothetical protein